MRRLWFALWLLVLGWDGLVPHLDAPAPRLAAVALSLGILLLASRRGDARPFGRIAAVGLAAGAGVTAALLPWPYGLGLVLVAAGSAISLVPLLRNGVGASVWRAPIAGGAVVFLIAALNLLWGLAEAARHDVDSAAPVLASLLRLLGVPAAADPPFVHVAGIGQLRTFDCTLERLIGHAAAIFFASGLVVVALLRTGSARIRALGAVAGIALLHVVLRMLALGLYLDDGPLPSIFWDRTWLFATLLPAVCVLALVVRPTAAPSAATATAERPARGASLAALAAATFALVAAVLGFHDPGRAKSGTVVVDEQHSNWEWSTIALDTESYGTHTVYNYSELVRYLQHFYEVERNTDPITDERLANVSVLILKTPTAPYEDREVDAIVRFVERGGGLWLIGDHTNIFGMSTNLNLVARRFGIEYHFDAVIDLKTNGRQLYERPRLFAHPVVRHLPPLEMATSCSMEAPLLAHRVMLGTSLLSDRLDYSVNSFFGDFQPDPSESFGSMIQSVAVERGRGRVLGFSDSTIFSNFFMFIRGKPELALASVSWLARENSLRGVRSVLMLAAVVGLGWLVVVARPFRAAEAAAVIAAAGLPAFAFSARALDAWVANFSRFPTPPRPLPLVAFERGRTDWHIPDFSELPENSPQSFQTFYVWTQRVGLIPMTHLFDKCLEQARSFVLLNPRLPFTPAEVGRLERWVQNGGRLLVMETPHARQSSANALLAPFGLRFEGAEQESVVVREVARGDTVAMFHHVSPVVGGTPLLIMPDGSAALATAQAGRGRVVAMCASDNFSDAVLGTTSQVPDRAQLALYRLEFRIFGELLRPDSSDAVPAGVKPTS